MSSRAALDAAPYTSARQEFLSLFPRRDHFIWKAFGDSSGWRKASGPLLDAQILGVVSDEGRGLFRGCYWSHKTWHAVLDVDATSKYHNSDSLAELAKKLSDVGLTAKLYQSSASGGWHLYLFFADWADSSQVHDSLKAWLKFHGYEIRSGVLELFPSGNALRLPLQKGFAWLDARGNVLRRREELSENEAITSFLRDGEECASDWNQAKLCMDSQMQPAAAAAGDAAIARVQALSLEGFEDLYGKGKIQEKWEKGREWWQRGLFEGGQRHDAVLAVGHYLWYGDAENNVPAYPGERHNGSRAQLIEVWLAEKHNGHCRHIREGRWEIVRDQIARAVIWRAQEQAKERPYYPVTDRLLKRLLEVYKKTGKLWDIDKMADANISRSQDARTRIARALRQCIDNGWQVTRNGLAELSGCSKNTVSKHKDVWFLLVSGSGVDLTRGALGDPDSFESSQPQFDLEHKEQEKIVAPAVLDSCSEPEEEFLSSSSLEDSRQASGCWEWDLSENTSVGGELCSEGTDAVCSVPLLAVSLVETDLAATSCAFAGAGEQLEESEGKVSRLEERGTRQVLDVSGSSCPSMISSLALLFVRLFPRPQSKGECSRRTLFRRRFLLVRRHGRQLSRTVQSRAPPGS